MTETTTDKPVVEQRECICPECGCTFATGHRTKRFCTPQHKQDYANREAAQGKVIASFVKAWRLGRGSKGVAKAAFAELCTIVDSFNAEDKAAGRPPASLYVKGLLDTGYLYVDRKR